MTSQDYRTCSFALLMDRHYIELVNFTTFNIKDRSAAETIALNIFIKSWQHYQEKFFNFENIRFYLHLASFHEGNAYLLSKDIGEYKINEQLYPVDLNPLLDKLPQDLQQILQLVHIDNLSIDQVSGLLNLSTFDIKRLKQKGEDSLAVTLHQKKL